MPLAVTAIRKCLTHDNGTPARANAASNESTASSAIASRLRPRSAVPAPTMARERTSRPRSRHTGAGVINVAHLRIPYSPSAPNATSRTTGRSARTVAARRE